MIKVNCFCLSTLMFVLFASPSFAASCNEDYAAVPPFLPTPVSPNILMVVDKSGSMSWSAYNPAASGTGFCWDTNGCGNVFTGSEEGYWVPTLNYSYSGNFWWDGGLWQESSAAVTACPGYLEEIYGNTNTYSGACVNFHLMTRIDLLRWAMTGGRPDACTDGETMSTDCDTSIQCSGATCVLHNIYNMRVEIPSSRIANSLVSVYENAALKPRFGLLFYSTALRSEKVYVGDYPADGATEYDADVTRPFTYFSRLLNAMEAGNGTGTAPSMWEAYDYFKQADDHPFANDFEMADATDSSTLFKDPMYVCDPDRTNCTMVPCAKNFVILATDGQWNVGGANWNWTCSIDTGFEMDSADPVVPAYRMHHDLLRTVTSPSGTTYDKRVDTVFGLGLFLKGTGLLSLQNTAVFGGYDTSDATDDMPGIGTAFTTYPSATCTMDDCGNGKGSACTPLPATAPDWDSDQDGVPDSFVNASGGTEMRVAIKRLIDEATRKAASGTSLSVLSEKTNSGSVVHQALFDPDKTFTDNGTQYDVKWVGSLNAYWYFTDNGVSNLREDNAISGEYALDKFNDYSLVFRINNIGELKIDYYSIDTDGSRLSLLGTYNDVDSISKIWEAGVRLKDRTVEAFPSVIGNNGLRKIYAINESGVMSDFTSDKFSDFDLQFGLTYADVPDCLGTLVDPVNPTSAELQARAENLVSYTRGAADNFGGNNGGNCRSRVVDDVGRIWKLGDIIYSTPRLVEYPEHSILITGANDGMLHAFDIGNVRKDGLNTDEVVKLCDAKTGTCTQNVIGDELWSFIPKHAMPYLKYLADPEYQHIYTLDLAPYLISHRASNGTVRKIIIGGMRMGGATGCTYTSGTTTRWCGDPVAGLQVVPPECGPTDSNCLGMSSYFALDVTDANNPIFLWEFTHQDLGFTYSGPAYIRRGGNGYVMFLNGPLNYRGETNGDLGLVDGQDLKAFILKVDDEFKLVDVNGDGVAGDAGDIFKFDGDGKVGDFVKDSALSNYNSAFSGRLFTNGVDRNKDDNTDIVFFGVNDASGASGNVTALVPVDDGTGGFDPTDKATAGGGAETANWYFENVLQLNVSPVTSKIEYAECFGSPYIYFGTGRWFYKDDSPGININDVEELYGIKIGGCMDSIASNGSCSINFAKNNNPVCGEVNNDSMGWYIGNLEPNGAYTSPTTSFLKERTLTDPTFLSQSNIISFTTTQPSASPCDFGGRSRIWVANCATGQSLWATDTCAGYNITPPDGSFLLQLSGGNIEEVGVTETSISHADGLASGWFKGVSSGASAPPPKQYIEGSIILWIER